MSDTVSSWARTGAERLLEILRLFLPDSWFRDPAAPLGWLIGLSFALFVVSLVALPLLVARMRADYFVDRTPDDDTWAGRHPAIRVAWLSVKNVAGFVLVLVGIAMLVLPGQGIMTILAGLTLLNFPGKRRVELALVRRRRIRRGIEWIRRRASQPPLVLPGEGPPDDPGGD